MVLKRKFSAHQYFEDIRKHNVTVMQYIGELCRYLLTVPEVQLKTMYLLEVIVLLYDYVQRMFSQAKISISKYLMFVSFHRLKLT